MGFRNWEIEMRSAIRWVQSSLCIACAFIAFVGNARAGVIVDISESNGDVVVNVSGSFRQLGNLVSTSGGTGSFEVGIAGNNFTIVDSSTSSQVYSSRFLGSGSSSWGNISAWYTSVGSLSGITDLRYIETTLQGGGLLVLDANYAWGTTITGSGTFVGKTLASMGLTNLGTYRYEVGDFGTSQADTLTFNIGSGGSAVPEPTSACIGLLMIGGGVLRHLRSKKRLVV